MTYHFHGSHLIAGQLVPTDTTFSSSPASGMGAAFSSGSPDLVGRACAAAMPRL